MLYGSEGWLGGRSLPLGQGLPPSSGAAAAGPHAGGRASPPGGAGSSFSGLSSSRRAPPPRPCGFAPAYIWRRRRAGRRRSPAARRGEAEAAAAAAAEDVSGRRARRWRAGRRRREWRGGGGGGGGGGRRRGGRGCCWRRGPRGRRAAIVVVVGMRGRPGLRRAPPAEEQQQPPLAQEQRPGPAAPSGGEAMLPWKRHKFELLAAAAAAGEEEAAAAGGGKGQGKAGGLPSPLGSLGPRACPPEGPLSRVGQLFRGKRQKFRVSREAPTYTVLYLGNATTLQAKGEGCTDAAVGRIWAKSEAGRLGAKMKLTIGPQGLRLAPAAAAPHAPDAAAAARPGHLYLLHRVTYCVADPRLPRLFAWVYRHEVKHKAVLLRCHAVLVSKAEKARAMALLLYQTSAAALAEFRRLKRRADARRQQLQQAGPAADAARPLLPLRRLLLLHGPAAAYKPPVERSRGAPKLGSITEDALGEELEERAARRRPRRRRHRHQQQHPGRGPDDDSDDDSEDVEEDDDDSNEDDSDELLAPLDDGRPDGAPSLGSLICGLGQLAIGNDPALLRADLRVTRLLSGESTGSESSIESNGPDGGSPPQPAGARDSPPQPDTG
ncbi:UNVERIFIED_CONTAM: Protein fam43a [Gekko kuhli]